MRKSHSPVPRIAMGSRPKMQAPQPPPPPPAQEKEAMQSIDQTRTAEMLRRRKSGRASTMLVEQSNAYGNATNNLLGG